MSHGQDFNPGLLIQIWDLSIQSHRLPKSAFWTACNLAFSNHTKALPGSEPSSAEDPHLLRPHSELELPKLPKPLACTQDSYFSEKSPKHTAIPGTHGAPRHLCGELPGLSPLKSGLFIAETEFRV